VRKTHRRLVAGSLIAAVLVSACGPDIVDGFALGQSLKCSPPIPEGPIDLLADASCSGDGALARRVLDAREPHHLAVVGVDMYSDGTQPGPIDVTGDAPVPAPAPRHPGPVVTVFVFTLADGSRRATGVACQDEPTLSCVGVGSYPAP
jgi:hypothetical protein